MKNSSDSWLVVILLIVIMGAVYAGNGVTLMLLWGWFVVPTFSLPPLSFPIAIGLSSIVTFLTYQVPGSKDTREGIDMITDMLGGVIARPVVYLGVGYFLSTFV